MFKIIAFPLMKVDNPFSGERLKTRTLFPVDWESRDVKTLSNSFNNQVKYNFVALLTLQHSCERVVAKDDVNISSYVEGIMEIYPISNGEKICNIFLERFPYYLEANERDRDALLASAKFKEYDEINFGYYYGEEYTFNTQVYPIVLMYKNIYHGHIFAWISPTNSSYCFAQGIRNRPDSIFRKEIDPINEPFNVSSYILEGVRLFALAHNCTKIVIPYPTDIMARLLIKMGFKKVILATTLIGKCIAQSGKDPSYASDCYMLLNPKKSLIKKKMNFNYIT